MIAGKEANLKAIARQEVIGAGSDVAMVEIKERWYKPQNSVCSFIRRLRVTWRGWSVCQRRKMRRRRRHDSSSSGSIKYGTCSVPGIV